MDPPPPPNAALPPLPNTKLRLMCSYGGSISPRPHNNSLFYSGGDTRILAVDRHTTVATLSAFTSHLSRTLYSNRPFTLKYQLPNEDLDSLISVTTDEDLQNMLEEHDRIVSSPISSRIRLFLFPSKPESVGTVLLDPKSESWFSDALKSTIMIQRGQSADGGLGNGFDSLALSDSSVQSLSNGNDSKNGPNFGSVSESMVLETSSSFGSTNSSISMSNLPAIGVGVHGEDGSGINLLEKKLKVASAGSVESDNSAARAFPDLMTSVHQEQACHVTSMESNVYSEAVESESIIFDPSSMIQMQKTGHVSGHQLPYASEQHQQEVQYIQASAQYIPQYPTGPFPIPSYYPMYNPPLHQLQHSPYQPSPPYPIYLLPVRSNQPSNMPLAPNLNNAATVNSSRPPLHPQTAMIGNTQVAHKEVAATPPIPELAASDIYRMVPATTPHDSNEPSDQKQQFVSHLETYHSSQVTASVATSNYNSEFHDDDLAYAQIYKSQPPAPALTPQYETMTKAAGTLSSETLPQLNGTSQP